jgi:hypothetical protein
MRFRLYTLVDITETGARRGDDPKAARQQQNFLTVLQTIGLRVNPTYAKSPHVLTDLPAKLGLGKHYKGKHSIWQFDFEIEYEGALDIDMLNSDFNLIPVIDDLDETVKFDKNAFITQDPTYSNIIFTLDDK